MSPTDVPRELLTLAERDYKSAVILACATEPQMGTAGFHLQQAVEKSLKAWLALKRVGYPQTHDLSLLFRLLEDAEEDIEPFWPLLGLTLSPCNSAIKWPGRNSRTSDDLLN